MRCPVRQFPVSISERALFFIEALTGRLPWPVRGSITTGRGSVFVGRHAAFFLRWRAAFTRAESSSFALFRSALRLALRFFPARLIKNVSILIPEPGPFGDTFFEANVRAMVSGSFVNNPSGG